jgi:hypothetical protein
MERSVNRDTGRDAETDRAAATSKSDTDADAGRVAWRDLSARSTPTESTDTSPSVGEEPVTNRIQARSGESLTIETDLLTVTLVGVPRVSIADLVYAHQQNEMADTDVIRHCALFDVENTDDAPLHWLSRRTSFIGTDGYTYGRAHVDLDPAALAPGCHTNHVVIQPRSRARVITPVEQLPRGVDIAAVIHTVASNRRAANQRFRFTL